MARVAASAASRPALRGPGRRAGTTTRPSCGPRSRSCPRPHRHVHYPDHQPPVRDAAGNVSLGPARAARGERPGDLLDGLLDNLVNGRSDEGAHHQRSGGPGTTPPCYSRRSAGTRRPAAYSHALEASGCCSLSTRSTRSYGTARASLDGVRSVVAGHGYGIARPWARTGSFEPSSHQRPGLRGRGGGLVAEAGPARHRRGALTSYFSTCTWSAAPARSRSSRSTLRRSLS